MPSPRASSTNKRGNGCDKGPDRVRGSSADLKVDSLPLSHVSIELGHLGMEDLAAGEAGMRETFATVAPWAKAAHTPRAIGCGKPHARISTCFLIEDYFSRFSTPAEVIPMVLSAAESEGLRIDYLAPESSCAGEAGLGPANLVLGRLVIEPVPGTTGARPPLTETGWLTNGQRRANGHRGYSSKMRSIEGEAKCLQRIRLKLGILLQMVELAWGAATGIASVS
jgi:hypothetical protein